MSEEGPAIWREGEGGARFFKGVQSPQAVQEEEEEEGEGEGSPAGTEGGVMSSSLALTQTLISLHLTSLLLLQPTLRQTQKSSFQTIPRRSDPDRTHLWSRTAAIIISF